MFSPRFCISVRLFFPDPVARFRVREGFNKRARNSKYTLGSCFSNRPAELYSAASKLERVECAQLSRDAC